MYIRRALGFMLALGTALLMTACGGGGSATSSSTPTGTSTLTGLNEFALSGQGTMLMRVGDQRFNGSSQVSGFESWIPLESVDLSIVRTFVDSAHAGTQDVFTGASDLTPLTMTKTIDRSSPAFLKSTAGGGKMAESLTLVVLATGAGGADVLTPKNSIVYRIDLGSPVMAGFSEDVTNGSEKLSIWYYQILVTFYDFGPKGNTETATRYVAGWDRVRNKSITEIPNLVNPFGVSTS